MTKKYTIDEYGEAEWKNINNTLYKVLRISFKFNRMKEYLYELLERRLGINIEKDCKNHAWKRKLEKGDYNFKRDQMMEELIRKNFHQVKSTFFGDIEYDPFENLKNVKGKWSSAIDNAHEYAKNKENYWDEFKNYLSSNYTIGFPKGNMEN